MKHFITLVLAFYCISASATSSLSSISPTPAVATVIDPGPVKEKPTEYDITKMKVRDFEKLAGKKLTLKEKIAFRLLQYQIKKEQKHGEPSQKGKTAFTLGLLSLCVLVIPYLNAASLPLAIIAIVEGNQAKRDDPYDRKAITGVILGWVTLGLLALAAILVVLLVLAFGGFH